MPLAAFKDLCLDANDVDLVGEFWSAVLGSTYERRADGVGSIRHDALHALWINPVAEPKTVKNRVHLDLYAASLEPLLGVGATAVADQGTFRVLQDPAGNELCVFPGDAPAAGLAEPFALCVDSDRPEHVAAWWQGLLGGELGPGPDGALRWLNGAAGLGTLTLKFVRVFDERQIKNRMHWDVETADVAALVDRGATVQRTPDEDIRWTVLDDVDGNVFCAFDR
ncbi:MAG: VOC family protein [Ilumatobacteraceae bacterium]